MTLEGEMRTRLHVSGILSQETSPSEASKRDEGYKNRKDRDTQTYTRRRYANYISDKNAQHDLMETCSIQIPRGSNVVFNLLVHTKAQEPRFDKLAP